MKVRLEVDVPVSLAGSAQRWRCRGDISSFGGEANSPVVAGASAAPAAPVRCGRRGWLDAGAEERRRTCSIDRPANAARAAHTATEFTSVSCCLPIERAVSRNRYSSASFTSRALSWQPAYDPLTSITLTALDLLCASPFSGSLPRLFVPPLFSAPKDPRRFSEECLRTHGLRSTRDERRISVMHLRGNFPISFCIYSFLTFS